MSFDLAHLRKVLSFVASVVIESKDLLTHIDNLSGDGDLGISMEKAANSVLKELDNPENDGIAGLLSRCAVTINTDAPSTMGTLCSFSVMEAAKIMAGKDSFSDRDLLKIPYSMINIIMIRGRAQPGDKTVLDALIPFADALSEAYERENDIVKAADLASDAAAEAANRTKGWVARIGRAKWIAERSRNCPDGGAVLCAIVVNAISGKRIEINMQ